MLPERETEKLCLCAVGSIPLAYFPFVPSFSTTFTKRNFSNSELTVTGNAFDLSEVPFLVAQRTYTSSLQPTLNTIEMKNVTTITEGDR